jgi:hypothetical protein
MRWGIVGAGADKFTPVTERLAREYIRSLLSPGDVIISGRSPVGGIDLWSIEEGRAFGLREEDLIEHPATHDNWEEGFKPRNKLIAEDAHQVVSIVVRVFPPGYRGRKFPFCYHCGTKDHVKSGGCWTAKYARSLGKIGRTVVIDDARV